MIAWTLFLAHRAHFTFGVKVECRTESNILTHTVGVSMCFFVRGEFQVDILEEIKHAHDFSTFDVRRWRVIAWDISRWVFTLTSVLAWAFLVVNIRIR